MADSLLVHEIYLSIQGESTFAGLPCIFVRLTGCDLRCSYCDTAYAFTGGKSMTVDEVVAELEKQCAFTGESGGKLPLVELTGGEPLLQKNVHSLMSRLCDIGLTVLVDQWRARHQRERSARAPHHGLEMPEQRRVQKNAHREHRPPQVKRRGEVRHRDGGGLCLGQDSINRAQIGRTLPRVVLLGGSA